MTEEGRRPRAHAVPAARAAGGHVLELPGLDHAFFAGDTDRILDEAERFVTGRVSSPPTDRVLTTVLFLDIVDSTGRAAALGDAKWEQVLAAHDRVVADLLARHSGIMVKSMGDGVLARFDGPARAIQCAIGLRHILRAVGLEVRIGLHTGEVVVRGDDIAGIAVHIAARVQEEATPGEVCVSRTVKALVLGSGIDFEERGRRMLKGVADPFDTSRCAFSCGRVSTVRCVSDVHNAMAGWAPIIMRHRARAASAPSAAGVHRLTDCQPS